MIKPDLFRAAKTGAWVTATVMIVNWALSFLNIPVKQLFGVTPATAITTTLGTKVMAILQNLVAFDPISIFYLYISASLICLVGTWLMGTFKLPSGKNDWQKLALVLLYGTIPFYLLLIGFGMPSFGTVIGIGVYYIVVALSLSLLKKQVSKFKLI